MNIFFKINLLIVENLFLLTTLLDILHVLIIVNTVLCLQPEYEAQYISDIVMPLIISSLMFHQRKSPHEEVT